MAAPKLRFKEFDGDWDLKNLGDCFSLFSGYAFPSSASVDNGTKWLKIADVGIQEMTPNNLSFLPNITAVIYPERKIDKIASNEANARVENPVKPCPTVQPIANTPPTPINDPPIILYFTLFIFWFAVHPKLYFLFANDIEKVPIKTPTIIAIAKLTSFTW